MGTATHKVRVLAAALLWSGCGGGSGATQHAGPGDVRVTDAGVESAPPEGSADAFDAETGGDDAPIGEAGLDAPLAEGALEAEAEGSCDDQVKDGSETDVDCGGGQCPACGPNKACLVDSDCSKTVSGCDGDLGGCMCDAVTRRCVYDHCFDQVKDGNETDVDCGGDCSSCAAAQGCLVDSDCTTTACDGVSLVCVTNRCSDHRMDGAETDVDCGGSDSCSRCLVGKRCFYNSDCVAGHRCTTVAPQVCQ